MVRVRNASKKKRKKQFQPKVPVTELGRLSKAMCHLIFLIPVIGLGVFLLFPFEAALPLYVVILATSALLYFVIWRALRLPIQTGAEGMIGKEARVVQDLNPDGVIQLWNELWSARSREPIAKGERVIILAVNGLVATVSRR